MNLAMFEKHKPIDEGLTYILGLTKPLRVINTEKVTNTLSVRLKKGDPKIDRLCEKVTNTISTPLKKRKDYTPEIPNSYKQLEREYSHMFTADELEGIYNSSQRQKSLPMQRFRHQILGVLREHSGIINVTLGYIPSKNPLMTLGTEYSLPERTNGYTLQELTDLARNKEEAISKPLVIVPETLQTIGFDTQLNQQYTSAKLMALDSRIE
jgi:hypothetical protein